MLTVKHVCFKEGLRKASAVQSVAAKDALQTDSRRDGVSVKLPEGVYL